jgi:hypothetical protein
MLALETSVIKSDYSIPLQPTFLIDIDETILAGVEAFLNKYPLNAKFEDVYSYDMDECLGHGIHNAYMNFLNTHKDIPAYPGALETLHEMECVGQLIIVTMRPPIQIQRFHDQYPGFTIQSKSESEWPTANFYIDDAPDPNLVKHSIFTCIVDRPWNKKLEYPRFPSLAKAWKKWSEINKQW